MSNQGYIHHRMLRIIVIAVGVVILIRLFSMQILSQSAFQIFRKNALASIASFNRSWSISPCFGYIRQAPALLR